MKKICLMIIVLFLIPFGAVGAPLRPFGPVDVSGIVSIIQWFPAKKLEGIPGMSGSAGHDRVVPAHFLIRLVDFDGVDAKAAITMTRYVDPSALEGKREKDGPSFILLRINRDDRSFLKGGMKIKVSDYTIRGDEGGTWTSYKKIEITDRSSADEKILDYLTHYVESPGSGRKMFCGYELFGTETKDSRRYSYLWALCKEYYTKNGVLMEGAGFSMPLALVSVYSLGGERIIDHQKPVDGEGYGESIRKIFPKKYHKVIFAERKEYDMRAENLSADAERQARLYYHLK